MWVHPALLESDRHTRSHGGRRKLVKNNTDRGVIRIFIDEFY